MLSGIILLASLGAVLPGAAGAKDVLATLDPKHPRLILKDAELARLKAQCAQDAALRKIVRDVLKEADDCCDKPPLKYKKIGPRLLDVSRDCVARTYALALAWRWTGEEKYAQKATENLLTVCAFADWNPSHFLDTAEMSHAVGIGYDWLYSRLSEEQGATIRAGLIRNGLEPGIAAYSGKGAWWVREDHNWNQVCNGGLLIGALSVAESEPDRANKIIRSAVESLPRALATYNPDGAWPEGPGYWHYATSYTAYGLAALETALGTDFGLSRVKGLEETGFFPLYTTGPTGLYLNFADSGERSRLLAMPCLFWLARRYEKPALAEAECALLEKRRAGPLDLAWYVPQGEAKIAPRSLDRCFNGPVRVAVFRSAWDDPDALWAGVKAGYNQVNHGHLDLGNFEMDALGVRWARDLGSDDYNLPGYWDKEKGGRRWTYYRLNSASHNVLMIDGQSQDETGKAEFLKFETGVSPCVVVDLTGAYAPAAARAIRGLALIADRRALLVQDELKLDEAHDIAWGMTTDATISVAGGEATLSQDGKELKARILAPAGAVFTVESAEQQPPQARNKGVNRLMIRLGGRTGNVRIAVLLAPCWKDGAIPKPPALTDLERW